MKSIEQKISSKNPSSKVATPNSSRKPDATTTITKVMKKNPIIAVPAKSSYRSEVNLPISIIDKPRQTANSTISSSSSKKDDSMKKTSSSNNQNMNFKKTISSFKQTPTLVASDSPKAKEKGKEKGKELINEMLDKLGNDRTEGRVSNPLALSETDFLKRKDKRCVTECSKQVENPKSDTNIFKFNDSWVKDKASDDRKSEQILSCIANLNNLLKQQSNSTFTNSSSLQLDNARKLNSLNSQLNISNTLDLAKGSSLFMSRDNEKLLLKELNENGLNASLEKDNIINEIYINSDNRIKRYKLLFDFISSNLQEINTLFIKSLNTKKQVEVFDTSPGNEYLKTDANDQNGMSILKDQSMQKIDEVTSILTVFNSTKTKVDLSNCDYNESDINEFYTKEVMANNSKQGGDIADMFKNHNENPRLSRANKTRKEIPSLKGFMDVKSKKSNDQVNNILVTKIVYNQNQKEIDKANYFEDERSSFLNSLLKANKEIFETKELKNELILGLVDRESNFSPIRFKNMADESMGIYALNSALENYEIELLEDTCRIDYDYVSERDSKDLDKTVKENYSAKEDNINIINKINFTKAFKNQDISPRCLALNEINRNINTLKTTKDIITIKNMSAVNPVKILEQQSKSKSEAKSNLMHTFVPVTKQTSIVYKVERKEEGNCIIF